MTLRVTNPTTDHPVTGDETLVLTGNPARDLARSFNLRVILFLLLHVPLGFIGEASPWVSTILALVALYFGLRAALLSRANQVVYVLAYIAGAEILWRMNRALVPWEYGKYAMVLIVIVAIAMEWRGRGASQRFATLLPLVFLVLLVPATAITVLQTDGATARDLLSFNLSGFLAYAMMALYFWARPLDRPATVRTLLALVAPVISIASLAAYGTLTFNLEFIPFSNWITSGNYGPNQVANMLGLGALAGVLLLALIRGSRGARLAILVATLLFLVQGVLTFSRGGTYSFVIAFAAFGLHMLRTPQSRWRFLLAVAVSVIVLAVVVFPYLNDFTSGALAVRFTDLDTTGRYELAQADIAAFLDSPLTGVGVGLAADYRFEVLQSELAAHTEYTRMIAEHGLLGLLAMLLIAWMLIDRYRANLPGISRGVSAAFALWSLSIMVHSAMRLAAIPFALALALVTWKLTRPEELVEPEADEAAVEPLAPAYNPGRSLR